SAAAIGACGYLILPCALSRSQRAFASCRVHPPFRLFCRQVEYLSSRQTCIVPPLLVGRVPILPLHSALAAAIVGLYMRAATNTLMEPSLDPHECSGRDYSM